MIEEIGIRPENWVVEIVKDIQGNLRFDVIHRSADGTFSQAYTKVCALAEIPWWKLWLRPWLPFEQRAEIAHNTAKKIAWTLNERKKRASQFAYRATNETMKRLQENPHDG